MSAINSELFRITCPLGSQDAKLFTAVVNQGIDAHLEAFTKSKFEVEGNRLVLLFDPAELKTLTRRLREVGSESAESWADDIEASQ
jgi:hypothetical protein